MASQIELNAHQQKLRWAVGSQSETKQVLEIGGIDAEVTATEHILQSNQDWNAKQNLVVLFTQCWLMDASRQRLHHCSWLLVRQLKTKVVVHWIRKIPHKTNDPMTPVSNSMSISSQDQCASVTAGVELVKRGITRQKSTTTCTF